MRIPFRIAPAAFVSLTVSVLAPAVHAQSTVSVNIDSTPPGATVRVGSTTAAPLGVTPLRHARVPSRALTLYFSLDGYLDGRVDQPTVRSGQRMGVQLAQAGRVYVTANVDGAQVMLDGNAVGVTPGTLQNVTPGSHVIELRQAGHDPFNETVNVVAGQQSVVRATLRPTVVAPTTGTVRVFVTVPVGALPSDVSVRLDGTSLAGPPYVQNDVSPGQHALEVSATGFRTVSHPATVVAGQTDNEPVSLEAVAAPVVAAATGTVRVTLVNLPDAHVLLDDAPMPGTPPARTDVTAGVHHLRVTAPGRQDFTQEITLAANETQSLTVVDAQLPQTQHTGRMVVNVTPPTATVSLEGGEARPGPAVVFDNVGLGDHAVTIRAPGFLDGTGHCTIVADQTCTIQVPLTPAVRTGRLTVALAQPLQVPVELFVDEVDRGPVGNGSDLDLPVGTHRIVVRAAGYSDYVRALDTTTDATTVTVTMAPLESVARRRQGISTWGGSPLFRGDLALDLALQYGAHPVEIRGFAGVLDNPLYGLDLGFAFRTFGWLSELELRGRFGFRFVDGLFGLGAQLGLVGGVGFAGQGTLGLNAWLLASFHAQLGQGGADTGPHAGNRLGSFSLSLRFGLETYNDGLNNMIQRPGFTSAIPDRFDYNLCSNNGSACPYKAGTTPMNSVIDHGNDVALRPLFGIGAELGLSRNWNLFIEFERVLTGSEGRHRAYYQAFWGDNDSLTYIRAGLTYKF